MLDYVRADNNCSTQFGLGQWKRFIRIQIVLDPAAPWMLLLAVVQILADVEADHLKSGSKLLKFAGAA